MMLMKQFLHDMFHMTEGEKFIEYWWLWVGIIFIIFFYLRFTGKREG